MKKRIVSLLLAVLLLVTTLPVTVMAEELVGDDSVGEKIVSDEVIEDDTVPEAPEEPSEPEEEPESPRQPEEPEQPETPEEPKEPTKPEEPVIPEEPEQPEEPVMPEAPVAAEMMEQVQQMALARVEGANDPCDSFEWNSISGGQMPFMYNHGMLFDDARQLSTDLSKASVIIADTAYKGKDAIATLMKNIGYTPLDNSASYDRTTSIYFNDVVAFTVAYCDVTYQGEAYRLYCVPVRGTAANSEWYSNFNIGTSGEHEGFHKAAKEVYNKITLELMNDSYDADHSIVWLTGHSRGAAVSNIVAGMLNENGLCCMPEHIFAYTFACPSVGKNTVEYQNIYNFNNPGDMITAVPLAEWGYDRNGVTVTLPLSQLDNLRQRFRAGQGEEYCSATSTTDYVTIFSSAIPTEDSMQEPAKKLMLLLAGYGLGGRTETSIWDLVVYSGYTVASSELSDIIQAAASIPSLSRKLAELSGVDANVIAFANEYWQTVQSMTEEQFAQFRADHASDISALEKAAAITINSMDVFAVARQIVQSRISECEKLTDVVAAVTALLMDSNGNLLSAITHGHQTETYIYWINSMFGGYKGWCGNTSVTSVTMPGTRTLSYGVFSGCSSLKEVSLSALKEIVASTFSGCSALTSIVIPDTVKKIGEGAFSNCSGLKEVTLPISAEYIVGYEHSGSSFFGCKNVQKIIYTVGDGTVFAHGDNYTLPYYACGVLTTVVYEEGITEIPAYALYSYYSCSALVSVMLPSTVKKIGASAFYGCSGLKDVYYMDREAQWKTVTISNRNEPLTAAQLHFVQDGDVNGSRGGPDVNDVQCLYTYLTSGDILGAYKNNQDLFIDIADVNHDGTVDVYDLQWLYEEVSGSRKR